MEISILSIILGRPASSVPDEGGGYLHKWHGVPYGGETFTLEIGTPDALPPQEVYLADATTGRRTELGQLLDELVAEAQAARAG